MKKLFFLGILIPTLLHAKVPDLVEVISNSDHPKNTIAKTYKNLYNRHWDFDRTIDFPTQIVRQSFYISEQKKTCEEVQSELEKFFLDHIQPDIFFYNTILYCGRDPITEIAHTFSIHSYFDPMTDAAVEYLKTYLKDHNGQIFLGSPFIIESAKGLGVSLNVDVGLKQDEYASVLLRQQHDNHSLPFQSNYEMLKYFISDLYKNMYSTDPKVILPFFGRWWNVSEYRYRKALSQSDYVLVQPERLFFMEKTPKVYTCPLRYYYAHRCEKYANKRCL